MNPNRRLSHSVNQAFPDLKNQHRETPHHHGTNSGVSYVMQSHLPQKFLKTLIPLRLLTVATILASGPLGLAQTSPQPVQGAETVIPKLNAEELSQLLAPIALYPDALIAVILPASTVPSDVVLGARFVQRNTSADLIDNQPWDESVKSLSRYPEVLIWMDENLEWTAAVGEAFVEQPADVMNVIQGLREQARAAGNLNDTPQQKVVVVEEVIRIVPADPEIIYVPSYDPQVVYVQSYAPVPLLSFGLGFAVGAWLNYDFDWNRGCLYRGNWRGWNHNWNNNNWNGGWGNQGGWGGGGNNNQANVVNIDINNVNQWQPSSNAKRQTNQRQRNNNGNARYVSNRSKNINVEQQDALLGKNGRAERAGKYNPQLASNLPRPDQLERRNRGGDRKREGDLNSVGANDRKSNLSKNGRENTPGTTLPAADETTRNPNKAERPGKQSPGSNPPKVGQDRGVPATANPSEKTRRQEDRTPQRATAQQPGTKPLVRPTQPAPKISDQRKQSRDDRRESKQAPQQAQPQKQQNQAQQRETRQQVQSERKQPQPQAQRQQPQPQKAQPQRQKAQPQRQQAQPQRQQAQPQRQQAQQKQESRAEAPKQQQRKEVSRPAQAEKLEKRDKQDEGKKNKG